MATATFHFNGQSLFREGVAATVSINLFFRCVWSRSRFESLNLSQQRKNVFCFGQRFHIHEQNPSVMRRQLDDELVSFDFLFAYDKS